MLCVDSNGDGSFVDVSMYKITKDYSIHSQNEDALFWIVIKESPFSPSYIFNESGKLTKK